MQRKAEAVWRGKTQDEEDARKVVFFTSTVSQPGLQPKEEAWRRHLQSVYHTGPASHPRNLPPLTFHSHSPSPFLHSPCDYAHPLAFLASSDLPLKVLSSYHSASFLIHPYDSTLLIPWTVSPITSSKRAYDLSISFCSPLLLWDLIYPASSPHPCSFQPQSFPLAASPLISIGLPSAWGEMKIDSPSSNCFSLAKEKGKAVSSGLSKAVHPSPFKVWRQGCSGISVAVTVTGERWSMGERHRASRGAKTLVQQKTCSVSHKLRSQDKPISFYYYKTEHKLSASFPHCCNKGSIDFIFKRWNHFISSRGRDPINRRKQ